MPFVLKAIHWQLQQSKFTLQSLLLYKGQTNFIRQIKSIVQAVTLFIIRTDSHKITYPVKNRLAQNYMPCLGERGRKSFPVQQHIPVQAIKGSASAFPQFYFFFSRRLINFLSDSRSYHLIILQCLKNVGKQTNLLYSCKCLHIFLGIRKNREFEHTSTAVGTPGFPFFFFLRCT